MTFRFEPNPDYYRDGDPHIDWLTPKALYTARQCG